MKLGLDSYSFHLAFGAHPDFSPARKMTLFEFIDRVEKLGLDGFQIDPSHIESRDDGYLAEILSYAKEKNLFLEYGTIGVDTQNLINELDVCKKLESSVLRTFIGFDRYNRKTRIRAEIERAIKQISGAKNKAEESGIRIAIENHGDVSTDELLEIVHRVDSPNVGICLDLGNSMMTLEDPLQAASKMASRAVSTHFKDYAIQLTNYGFKVVGVALGDGNINLQAALKLITEKSDLDCIILEIPVEAEFAENATLKKEYDYIRRSVQYARDVLGIKE
ncbi:sugar phosphate isomerase/epimerase [candidate division KSB1 bacterium]|nr:sugar phosphate isomerase/epimerase [candidate division KSB1 bacterium]